MTMTIAFFTFSLTATSPEQPSMLAILGRDVISQPILLVSLRHFCQWTDRNILLELRLVLWCFQAAG